MTISYLDSVVRMPMMTLPVRTPIVHLAGADILISPGSQLTPAQLASAGRITDLVGPSFLHLRGLPQAIACLPAARVWGPKGAKVRRKQTAWTGELSAATWPYQSELPLLELGGMAKVREVFFFHKASRTLIVTDLCFNLLDARGLGARFILGLFGTYGRLGVSRLYLRFVTDRAQFEESLCTLFAWEFDNIAVSHGRLVEGGGRAKLLAALQERGLCKDVT